jgi:ATP-dependent Lon protease
VPLRFRVLLSEVDDRVKAAAIKKVDGLVSMDGSAYHKVLQWVEGVCALPIGRYRSLPVGPTDARADIARFLGGMRAKLDAAVYGHAEAKGHIVRLLAQWVTHPTAKGLVLGVHGPPGVGKTELCKAVCRELGLPFAFIPLGGANDGCYLDGHSYTYEGATWGKIASVLMKCGVMNPVLFFDELDKVSTARRGEEIVNLLIHLTDATQNDKFNDKFFVDVELDLSKCLCIFSYNDEALISPILRDRMIRVRTDGYALKDKQRIARDHLLPSILSEFAMAKTDVAFSDGVLAHAVEVVEEEQGVRNLRRALHDCVSSINYERLVAAAKKDDAAAGGADDGWPVEVTRAQVDAFVRSGRKDAAQDRINPSVMAMYM